MQEVYYERFTEIVIHILEKMAQEMKWYDQTQRMALTLMQHQLFGSEEIPGIEFYRDASQHTLVIMLDDSEDNLTGWDGGEFLFKLIETTLPIYRIYPQVGWGILFSNEGTRHAVTPMRLKNASCKWIERMILSLHQL